MSYQPRYDDYAPQQNGLAISAFVVSIVGILTCGVLSPVGLIMSLIAMRRHPRGLAIAGTIISSLGFLGLLTLGGMTIYGFVKAGQMADAMGKTLITQQTLELAATEIEAHARRHGDVVPADADGATAIRHLTDAWGRPLRYRRVDDGEFELTSAGADGTFDTADDHARGRPLVPPATAPAIPAPDTRPEKPPAP